MQLVDTHCHIHSKDYKLDIDKVYEDAKDSGVDKLICIGTDLEDSKLAVEFANKHLNTWASIGIHPHEADKYTDNKLLEVFSLQTTSKKVVAIGECGLDYFYNHSSKKAQEKVLRYQIELATKHQLPLIFHVRNGFDDFWPILDSYPKIRGVLHSFTDDQSNLDKAIERGLFIGVNGIATFSKNPSQIEVYKQIPLANLVLETDAPYLTPTPFRGMICEPKHVKIIADFLAKLRGETSGVIADQTTENANLLFRI
jgi:TatD DNase family protein